MAPINLHGFNLDFFALPDFFVFLMMILVYIVCFPLQLPYSKKNYVAWSFFLSFIFYMGAWFMVSYHFQVGVYALLGMSVVLGVLLSFQRYKYCFQSHVYLVVSMMTLYWIQLKGSWITATCLLVFYLLARVIQYFELFEEDSSPFVLSIELEQIQFLDELVNVLNHYNVTVLDKMLNKYPSLHVTIRYKAPRLVHHLLLKRLYRFPGLGNIVSL